MNKNHIDVILLKMFEAVGATYDPSVLKEDRWYMKYKWAKEEEDVFKKWLVSYILKNKICVTKKMAENEAEHFVLFCGWTYKEK